MKRYEKGFLQGMKKKLQADLIGVASVDKSPELKEKATIFLPTARSVVVFAKQTYKEVIASSSVLPRRPGRPNPGKCSARMPGISTAG